MNKQVLNKGNHDSLRINQSLNTLPNNEPLRVLSEEDWQFWQKNGYVIIQNAVSEEHIERLVNLIWEFEEKNPADGLTPKNYTNCFLVRKTVIKPSNIS